MGTIALLPIVAMRNAFPSDQPGRETLAYDISWNIWTKPRDSQPIRHSVAGRLLDRIGHDGALISQCIRYLTSNGIR